MNEEIITQYFSKMDAKIYYGDNNVAQPIECLKKIYDEVLESDKSLSQSSNIN